MAAYAGRNAAAPILFRMLQSQEGLGGGHYNGIATIHEGKIHMIKCIGSTADLLRRYPEVLELPGTVGIAHSRTPGIDSDEWAQPFFAHDEQLIYCANGAAGRFAEVNGVGGKSARANYDELYLQDKADGIRYRTLIDKPAATYPVMSDGCCVHSSEVMANFLRRTQKKGMLVRQAMAEASFNLKSEIAALALAVAEPDTVSAIRINQPLMWGRKEDGFYLATSAFALENEKIDWINPVPAASVMSMGRDKIEFESLDSFMPYFAGCNPLTAVYKTLDDMFDSGKDFCVNDFCVEAAKCWPEDKLAVANMTVYEYLREKVHSKVIEGFSVDSPGSGAGLIAPQTRFRKIRG
jgi:glutamine phosphoribosylpyrophosphate amidotransferase